MATRANLRVQQISAWSGIAFAILYPIFWAWYGHARPPLPPTLSPAEVADFYITHRQDVLIGMTISAVVGALWIPWTAQLAIIMRRIEGDEPVLALIQLIGGALTAWVLIFTPAIWVVAAYRPHLHPDVIQSLSDTAYLTFALTYAITTVQAVAAGIAGLMDKSADRVFPRWVCWFAILAGVSFFVVSFLPFHMTGPLAMNGSIVSVVPGSCYFVWTLSMGYYMIRDANRRRRA